LSSRPNLRPFPLDPQGSSGESPAHEVNVDTIRDHVATRSPGLDLMLPAACDLEAAALAALHERIHGRATELCGRRSPKERREQLRGERPLTLSDVAQLTIQAPDDVVPLVAVLASRLGYQLVPMAANPPEPHDALAGLIELSSAVAAELSRALRDLRLDRAEAEHLAPQVRDLKCQLARIEAMVLLAKGGGR